MNRILAEEKALSFRKVEIHVLDEIVQERNIAKVDFIKLDVEGFELFVLAGAASVLKSKPVLFIELDDNNLREHDRTAKELVNLSFSYGYTDIYDADNLASISPADDFNNCHIDIIAK